MEIWSSVLRSVSHCNSPGTLSGDVQCSFRETEHIRFPPCVC
uniref:Uncharacterized protein n=1 Tax=Anguilla anguilla TaxID=7936 RepID=A0A0E9XL16_ANGAN